MPRPCKLTFDLLTLKEMSESRVTCPTSVPILVCSRLRPDVRDRQTSDAHHRLMPPTLGAGHSKGNSDGQSQITIRFLNRD